MDRSTTVLGSPSSAEIDVTAEPDGWRFELRPGAPDPAGSAPGASPAGPDSVGGFAAASRWLVDQLAGDADPLLSNGFQLRRFTRPVPPPAGERIVTADQTHRSVIVGEQVVVKWLRRVDGGPNPALPALAHLAEVGFTGVPPTFGALTWRSPSGRDLPCAFATGFLAGAVDGWQWCVEALETGSRPGFPAELGRLAARLHVALGTPSTLFPLPVLAVGAAQVRGWHDQARSRLAELAARIGELDGTPAGPDGDPARLVPSSVLAAHQERMASVLDRLLDVPGRTPVQQVHGDLHVGQILSWSGGLSVIDFDGSPVVDGAAARQPAARDVAQLLLSLDQVARVVDRRSGFTRTTELDAWSIAARSEFLFAYRAVLDEVERPDVLDVRLLPSFLVEQAVRDLLYAARFLPRWAYATVDGLDTVLADLPS